MSGGGERIPKMMSTINDNKTSEQERERDTEELEFRLHAQ